MTKTDHDHPGFVILLNGYEDLDRDLGDTVFYSGSNSHENTDPDIPGTETTSNWNAKPAKTSNEGIPYFPSKAKVYISYL